LCDQSVLRVLNSHAMRIIVSQSETGVAWQTNIDCTNNAVCEMLASHYQSCILRWQTDPITP